MPETTARNQKNGTETSRAGLLKSVSSVGLVTLLSRFFGLIRDLVFAHLIGAGAAADAFYVAFKIPNFFRRLFSEGAFSQAFVPVLSDYRANSEAAQVRYLIGRVSGTLGMVLFAFTALVVVFADGFISVVAFGFRSDPQKLELAAAMLRVTFPYLLLISLTGMAGAVLNSYDRFAVPAFTPVLLNVCLISAAFYISPAMAVPAFGLAWGVFIAGIVQLLFQLPFLASMHLLPMPRWGWSDPGVKRILTLMLPAIFGVSVSQINLLLDTLLASFLPTGSVSWLYYSDRLSELPLGVIGIAIATVILPDLSRQRFAEDKTQFSRTLDWALRIVFLAGVPAAAALIVLAEPVLATLFLYGEFNSTDLQMSALSLQAYAAGLPAFMLVKVLAPGYYAQEDMKTPVRIGIIAMSLNMVFNLAFVYWLYFTYQIGHVGLAMATSLSACINAGLLYRGLRQNGSYSPGCGWTTFVLKLLTSSLLMCLVLLYLINVWNGWLEWSAVARAGYLLVTCGLGLMTFLLSLFVFGLRWKDAH